MSAYAIYAQTFEPLYQLVRHSVRIPHHSWRSLTPSRSFGRDSDQAEATVQRVPLTIPPFVHRDRPPPPILQSSGRRFDLTRHTSRKSGSITTETSRATRPSHKIGVEGIEWVDTTIELGRKC